MPAQTRLDQVRDLVNQWEQLVGFSVSVPDWAINAMAEWTTTAATGWISVSSLADVGNWMSAHIAGDNQAVGGSYLWTGQMVKAMPWALYGMSAQEYGTKRMALDSTFQQLTGQPVSQDLIDKALRQNQGTMTGPQFQTWLLGQANITNTYGWLKYGLDFQQFQQQKLQMATAMGGVPDDATAVAQLQYLHASQGPNMSVAAQQTFTQQERKTVQQGSQSVVR